MKKQSKVLALVLCLSMIISGFAFMAPITTEAASIAHHNAVVADDSKDPTAEDDVNFDDSGTDATEDTSEVIGGLDNEDFEPSFSVYFTPTSYNKKTFSEFIKPIKKGQTVTYTKASELAKLVNLGYTQHNDQGSISITKGKASTVSTDSKDRWTNYRNNTESTGGDVYVVCLSGTDFAGVAGGETTGVFTDLLVGFQFNNQYAKNVKAVIRNNIPKNSMLVLSGHSLGGMVAQQVAADTTIKNEYDVINVVTFGSPLINGLQREGELQRLGDTADVVPYLSVNTLTNFMWQVKGLNRESGGYWFFQPITAHCQSYQRDDVWGAYDPFGVKNGGGTLTVNYSTTKFYISKGWWSL